ncbi:hypothetical protein DPSP01_013994 [Paraphaeosphaeria sporulosa]
MFGRRRPLLGAALVVGASRSAARHEVEREAQRSAEMQWAAEKAAVDKRREEEERDRRTQLALDEAIAKERQRTESTQSSRQPGVGEKQAPNVRYCPSCGHACLRGAKFCSMCGEKQPEDDSLPQNMK